MAGATVPTSEQTLEQTSVPTSEQTSFRVPPLNSPAGLLAGAVLDHLLEAGGPRIVYQPQLSLSRLTVTGYEALARFPERPFAGTERWFTFARLRARGFQLEAAAVRQALGHGRPAGATLAVNLSPGILAGSGPDGRAMRWALPEDLTGIEIELTEQADQPGSLGRLRGTLRELRERGAQIAIDDVGVAHSGLRRVIELQPDRLKIDRHLVTGVAANPAKAALIRTIVDLAAQIGATVCAEGVETVDDLLAVAELNVDDAQGWLVGAPEPGFGEARPIAVSTAQRSLGAMLDCRTVAGPVGPAEPSRSLPNRLGAATEASQVSRLVDGYAPALGAEMLVLSPLNADRSALRALPGLHGRDDPSWYPLADYPTTDRCLREQVVVPVYAGSTGDPSEWGVMADFGYRSCLLVPVLSRGRAVALLECYRGTTSVWSRREIRQAADLAAMVGPALELVLARPPAQRPAPGTSQPAVALPA